MATAKVNGRPEQPPPSTTVKCRCCPYGFHIDLGFVDFVENVVNGVTAAPSPLNDGFGSRRNSIRKTVKTGNNTTPGSATTDKSAKRTLLSPLDSLFSDSLENVVSDFEETLNSRGCNSDRESIRRLERKKNNVRSNGYFSDFGTAQISRSLPPRIPAPTVRGKNDRSQPGRTQESIISHYDAGTLSRKRPSTPGSGSQQQAAGYRTALGRTMCEIKSKRHDEHEDDLRRALFTVNGYGKHDSSGQCVRSQGLNSNSAAHEREATRSPYEQGKANYLGSRTPDMPRRTFTLTSPHHQYTSDAESVQPRWRIRSPVQRSSSALDMDHFASMRRRKVENCYPPLPYPRNCSLYAERLRRELSSPPHLSVHSSGTEQHSALSSVNEMKVAAGSRTVSATLGDSRSFELTNDDVLAQSNGADGNGLPCLQCIGLQQQLSDLSLRLQLATSEMNDIALKGQQKPVIVDKRIGSSYPSINDAITETISVEIKDSAGDALRVETDEKRTSVSLMDRKEMHWHEDIASSPIPQPRSYSIGITTDRESAPPHRDAWTDAPIKELLAGRDVECHTESAATNECGCGNDMPMVMCDFSCLTDRAVLVETGTGSKQTVTLTDSSSMTAPVISHSRRIQTECVNTSTISVSTPPVYVVHRGVEAMRVSRKDSSTVCDDLFSYSVLDATTQMDHEFDGAVPEVLQQQLQKTCETVALQTEFGPEQSEPRVLNDSEIAESLWLMPSKDTTDVAVGNEEDVVEPSQLVPLIDPINLDIHREREFLGENSDDEDTICIVEESLSDTETIHFDSLKSAEQWPSEQRVANDPGATDAVKVPRALGHARAAIVKKMLTERTPQLSFVRGTITSKSWRAPSRKGDPLQYIADQHKTQNLSMPSTPQTTKGALKEKVVLKKDFTPPSLPLPPPPPPPMPPSKVPDPVPARIPRPKISKYTPGETVPQSPDEEAEIADRLTPLRSEMRTLRTYSNGRIMALPRTVPAQPQRVPPAPAYCTSKPPIVDDSSSSSSDSEGSYDTNEAGAATQFSLTPQLSEAIEILKKHFQAKDSVDTASLVWATKHAKHEWLKTAARKASSASQVEGFIDSLEAASDAVLKFVVNLTDPNENTALHYAVSHGNFDVVSVLLDSRACNLDRANKAGYTAVMLAALCDASDEVESAVIHRLFQLGDVNAQAVQHGQTALMLAVSHGKMNTTKLLIDCQADLNIQDEEGSTALMCAAEHGHKEIVKLLLAQPDIDASLSDCDSSTALSIAVENGHRDIGVLIYAHLNHASKKGSPNKDSTS